LGKHLDLPQHQGLCENNKVRIKNEEQQWEMCQNKKVYVETLRENGKQ
jgi:hypothetical protein